MRKAVFVRRKILRCTGMAGAHTLIFQPALEPARREKRMMIRAKDAIEVARRYIGTPYRELDCISLIKKVIRTSPGGVPDYTTAGTNTLWDSYGASSKYRDLIWRQEGIAGAKAGMLAFKRSGSDVHHVGLVTDVGTVIHSSSTQGGRGVVETPLDSSWDLLAVHRYIEPADGAGGSEDTQVEAYKMKVVASSLNVRDEPNVTARRIGRISEGAVVIVQASFADNWKYITYGDGALGYVDGSYLAPYEEPDAPEPTKITIIDSAGNQFVPVGDWRVLIGSID